MHSFMCTGCEYIFCSRYVTLFARVSVRRIFHVSPVNQVSEKGALAKTQGASMFQFANARSIVFLIQMYLLQMICNAVIEREILDT